MAKLEKYHLITTDTTGKDASTGTNNGTRVRVVDYPHLKGIYEDSENENPHPNPQEDPTPSPERPQPSTGETPTREERENKEQKNSENKESSKKEECVAPHTSSSWKAIATRWGQVLGVKLRWTQEREAQLTKIKKVYTMKELLSAIDKYGQIRKIENPFPPPTGRSWTFEMFCAQSRMWTT